MLLTRFGREGSTGKTHFHGRFHSPELREGAGSQALPFPVTHQHSRGIVPSFPAPSSSLGCAALELHRSQISEEDGNNYCNANNNSGMLMKGTIKGSRAFIPGNILINPRTQLG